MTTSRVDRRLWFFLAAAVVSAALTPPTPPEFRWVPLVIAAAYAVLVVLVALDSLFRKHDS